MTLRGLGPREITRSGRRAFTREAPTIHYMDAVAVVLGVAMFAVLYLLIMGVDRV